jgi:hypothetical protein
MAEGGGLVGDEEVRGDGVGFVPYYTKGICMANLLISLTKPAKTTLTEQEEDEAFQC